MTDATALLRRIIASWDEETEEDFLLIMADVRAYLAAAPTPDVRLIDDDALRYACRVLESNAPESDRQRARDGLMEIRKRVRDAAQPVECECGDRYPHRSWESGFLAGRGYCINCACARGESLSAPPARADMDEQMMEFATWFAGTGPFRPSTPADLAEWREARAALRAAPEGQHG